ncbi:HAMP domain-containing protein [Candidatus Sulfidibacterium hydrothermale]|uniref:sensor histidine kinase n=1 Tax=Candidatus Sulfidibacterium hydrothermale TaxID=2875962 RepID=UPI001F0B097C|nr:ATP-binding protein [Candidatus Sulfidibacterium hydrothermale]UBM61285.1 HAMP domain-containing protein [Candidatus Sulfidibacterium hydrothermale]
MNSIYRKLVIYFLALNLFAIGSVGIYSYYKEKEALLSRTFDQLISVRQEKKNRILSFFRQRINDMKNMAAVPGITRIFDTLSGEKQPLIFLSYLEKYLKNAGCYRQLIILPENGNAKVFQFQKISKKPTFFKDTETVFLRKALNDKDSLRETFITEMYLGPDKSKPSLVLGKHFFDRQGRKIGMLLLEIKRKPINTIMFDSPNNGLGKTGEVYLVGSDQRMRTRSRFLKNSVFRTKVTTPGALDALEGKTGEAQFNDYRHIPVLSAYSPLHFSGIRWAILAEIDLKEAMIPIYSIRDNIIYLSLLIALLSAAIITFLAKKIADPIKKMKEETAKIASGEYGNTMEVKTKDEIGDLTRAFNEMSVKLKNQADRLEKEKKLRLRSVLDAQEKERQRLSRELHDGLGPLLLTGKMKLENALETEIKTLKKNISEVIGLFSKTVQEIRTISNNMMPAGLKEFGLAVALENFCRQMEGNNAVKIHCHIELSKKHFDKTTDIYLFRIAQEAINNVLKHAGATEIHISLEEIEHHLYFTIVDDGCGFDSTSAENHQGNGLVNIKERVNLLNGYFELKTAPGKGTRIDIDIPLT